MGDFNIYYSDETAFQKLLNTNQPGYFIDPLNLIGTWNNAVFAPYHTQSPRTRSFGGGATGGMDDRFDMLLFSQGVIDSGGITYLQNSYTAFGNDGMHFNDSINKPPNNSVGQTIADALHYASDHLPIYAEFSVDEAVPVEMISFIAEVIGNDIKLKWRTATELNNLGWFVQRSKGDWIDISFIKGASNSTEVNSYSFSDEDLAEGIYYYRLKQVDLDGSIYYSKILSAEVANNFEFNLNQNFPNPFNSFTEITYSLKYESEVQLIIYDILGNVVKILINELQGPGYHKVELNAENMSSGIYYYKLQTKYFSSIKKLVFVK